MPGDSACTVETEVLRGLIYSVIRRAVRTLQGSCHRRRCGRASEALRFRQAASQVAMNPRTPMRCLEKKRNDGWTRELVSHSVR